MDTENFLELLPQLKTLVSSPATIGQAKTIVGSVPDMCYALIKVMVELKLVDPQTTARILAGSATGASLLPESETPVPAARYPSAPSAVPAYLHNPDASRTPVQSMTPPKPFAPSLPVAAPAPTPTQSAPPSAAPEPGAAAALLASLPEDQRNAMLAIISMTPDQIRALPPDQATSLMELRRRFLGSG